MYCKISATFGVFATSPLKVCFLKENSTFKGLVTVLFSFSSS